MITSLHLVKVQFKGISIINKELERFFEDFLDLLDSECASCNIVGRIMWINYSHWFIQQLGVNELLVSDSCNLWIEVVAVEVQDLLQVLAYLFATQTMQECRGHKDQTIRVQTAKVWLIQVVFLKDFLQDQHYRFQTRLMNVKFLNVIYTLENMVDFCRAILKGDIDAEVPHVFINDTKLLTSNKR